MEPVVVPFRLLKTLFLTLLFTPFALVVGNAVFHQAIDGGVFPFRFIVQLIIAISFAATAIQDIYILLMRPDALRFDASGISGFLMVSTSWQDIESISAFKGRKGRRYLGVVLKDPAAFRARQSYGFAIKTRLAKWHFKHDMVVSEFLLKGARVADLAKTAEQFRAARVP